MKKSIISLGLMLAAMFTLTNCAEEIEPQQTPEQEGIPFEIIASLDDATKVANNGLKTEWEANDAVAVFYNASGVTPVKYSANNKFVFKSNSTDRFVGTLAVAPTAANNDWRVFYPNNQQYLKDPVNNNGSYTVYGGSTQTQDGANSMKHLAGSGFPMWGVAHNVPSTSTPAVSMSHICSVIKIIVTNNTQTEIPVNEVSFSAPGYDVAGKFYCNFSGETPVLTKKTGSTGSSVKLVVNGNVVLAPGASADFYVGVAPFEIDVTTANKTIEIAVGTYSKTLTLKKNLEFVSGNIKPIPFSYNQAPESNAVLENGNYVVMYKQGNKFMGLSSEKSTYNISAKPIAYTDGGQSVTVTKDMIWTITYDPFSGYSFMNLATGDYLKVVNSGSHNNAGFGKDVSFHGVEALAGKTNTFKVGGTAPLWYKSKYTEFTFDGGAETGTDELLIVPATMDNTPVFSLAAATKEIASAAVNGAELTTVTVNDYITETKFSVSSDQGWLTNLRVAGGKLLADVAENTNTASRTAKVTVTYTGAKVETQNITVTQVAAGGIVKNEILISWAELSKAGGWPAKGEMNTSATINDFTFSFAKGTNNNNLIPKAYSSEMRFYGGNQMTISHSSKKISKVVLNNGTEADYNGEAVSSVTLKNPRTSQIKVTSITITIE